MEASRKDEGRNKALTLLTSIVFRNFVDVEFYNFSGDVNLKEIVNTAESNIGEICGLNNENGKLILMLSNSTEGLNYKGFKEGSPSQEHDLSSLLVNIKAAESKFANIVVNVK